MFGPLGAARPAASGIFQPSLARILMMQGRTSSNDFRRCGDRRLHGRRLQDKAADLGADRLLHELQVHQMELEIQNQELRRARADTEAALSRYTELYDHA